MRRYSRLLTDAQWRKIDPLHPRPLTLGQASRIPGITPAAVSLVNCYIEIFQRRAAEQTSV
jgi:tRNA U34 5-carboxymethylaminomethyl modifying enzyme MnmG/GidA